MSIYSLYIGHFNSISLENDFSIAYLYSRIPEGIYYQFTRKLGFPLLFIMITVNSIIIRKYYYSIEGQKILKTLKWIGIFALIYIILLPFGGYRIYRPNVLRFDTIMPITFSLIFIYGASTLFLIKKISNKNKKWYYLGIICFLSIFTIADKPNFDQNDCEKYTLFEMSNSKENVILLENDCRVLSWGRIETLEQSKLNSELLYFLNVTTEVKQYRHKVLENTKR